MAPRTWLVTGSSRGFGREIVRAALAAGDQVVATARRPEQLDDLVEAYGDRIRAIALDVTDAQAARDAVAVATSRFGRLDIVVNNAGYANSAPIEEMDEDDFRAQIEANLFGVVNVTRAALPVLREQRPARSCSSRPSADGSAGRPGMGAYQAAKFGVEGFSEVLANEVAPFGVKVVIVEPGAFRTDWQGARCSATTSDSDYAETVGATAPPAGSDRRRAAGRPRPRGAGHSRCRRARGSAAPAAARRRRRGDGAER